MPVAVGPYGQSQPSCFDRVKMGFVMGCAVGMAAGALFGTFSCLRIGMRGRELMGGIRRRGGAEGAVPGRTPAPVSRGAGEARAGTAAAALHACVVLPLLPGRSFQRL